MHGDAALSEEVRRAALPNSRLKGEANLLIMPTLDAANISFNLLKVASGDGVTLGPILLGVAKPMHILTPSATVRRIVNMTALTVVDGNSQRAAATCSCPALHASGSATTPLARRRRASLSGTSG